MSDIGDRLNKYSLALAEAVAERGRYLEALQEIADYVWADDTPEGLDAEVMRGIARKALNAEAAKR